MEYTIYFVANKGLSLRPAPISHITEVNNQKVRSEKDKLLRINSTYWKDSKKNKNIC